MMNNPATLASKEASEEARKEAARLMGSTKTEKKAAAARANGFKPGHPGHKNGGRKMTPLSEILCSCGGGDTTELWTAETDTGHKWNCKRAQAIKRRASEGRDLQTGEKLPAVIS